MGALPDREPLVGAQPFRSPDQAPPLFAVPGRSAPGREEPPPAPPSPEPAPLETGEPVVEPAPPEPVSVPASAEPKVDRGRDQEEFVGVPWWAHLRPPDVWNTPAPTLAEEVARARRGDHLPESGPWRTVEVVRAWISALINTALLLLVHVNRSAGRQAVMVLFVAVIVTVLATR